MTTDISYAAIEEGSFPFAQRILMFLLVALLLKPSFLMVKKEEAAAWPTFSTPVTAAVVKTVPQPTPVSKTLAFNSSAPSSTPINKPIRTIRAAVLTAYSSTPDQTDDSPSTTASNKEVYDGVVANNCLSFGTKIKIPAIFGDKVFTIEDRMNARYGCGNFDIWFDDQTKKKVKQFGVHRAEVEILPEKTIPSSEELRMAAL